jgi:cytochrome P450
MSNNMKQLYATQILMIATIFLLLVLNWETIQVNLIVFFTLQRGVISQNCFWWGLNDFLPDATGSQLYQSLKTQGRFVTLNILGEHIYLLTDVRDIQELLELSPDPFGPGKIKKNFFSTFIPNNVGISTGTEWKTRREYNDKVLETDKLHQYNQAFGEYIEEVFTEHLPKTFEDFTEATRKITSKILFGTYDYNPIFYKVFKQADSLLSARFNVNTVDSTDLEEYRDYMRTQLEHPKPNTLISLANTHHKLLPTDSVIDQIPHWVFPIAGLFSVHLPRLLVMLSNHPDELLKVKQEIREETQFRHDSHVRKCILEMFRLNNAVNSTFRGLTEDFTFKNSEEVFEKGTQFVFFNNSVLRDLFEDSNRFIPSRWNVELEESNKALMFNQHNQRCPGKELVISLLTQGVGTYLRLNNYSIETNIKLNTNFIPYILNPCTIVFQ